VPCTREREPYACLSAHRPRIGWRKLATLDRVLDNSITYYSGRESCIEITGLGEADASTAKKGLVPMIRLACHEAMLGPAGGHSLFLYIVGLYVVLQTLVETLGVRNKLKERTGIVSTPMATADDVSPRLVLTIVRRQRGRSISRKTGKPSKPWTP